jgi:hypothetical protein
MNSFPQRQEANRSRDFLIPSGLPLAEAETIADRFADELPEELQSYIAASKRPRQTRIGFAAAALAVFLTISGLAVYSTISRTRAEMALDRGLAAIGSIVLKLGTTEESPSLSSETRAKLVNDVCDLFDDLRTQAEADARARPLLICYEQRAKDYEASKDADRARQLLQMAVAEAVSIHARSHTTDDGRSIVLALNELGNCFDRQGDTESLAATLREGDATIAALQADYPDQPFFPEARTPPAGPSRARRNAGTAGGGTVAARQSRGPRGRGCTETA